MPQYYENVQKAMDVAIAESSEMSQAMMLWDLMYRNKAPWLTPEIKTLSLPSGICSEMATAVTMEARIGLREDNEMGHALQNGFAQVADDIGDLVELISGYGSVVLKPYVSGGRVLVDYVRGNNVFPVQFGTNRQLTSAIFPEFITRGKMLYTRLEFHEYDENSGKYTIINRAFESVKASVMTNEISNLGKEIPLDKVPQWADLEPEVVLHGATLPLFVYLRCPIVNHIDPDSPIGVSLYARSPGLIQQADEQWGATIWEYRSKETAIQAGREFFKTNINTGEPIIPAGKERLYTDLGDATDKDGAPFFNVYSPQIRDTSFFNAFNRQLQRIEFNCRLSYGTLSDPQSVDKTATEVKASKQRFYSTVKRFQESVLRPGLQHLADAMAVLADQARLAPYGYTQVFADFDDSVVVDKESERKADLADVAAGIMQPWEYRMKYYRETEERARSMIMDDPELV